MCVSTAPAPVPVPPTGVVIPHKYKINIFSSRSIRKGGIPSNYEIGGPHVSSEGSFVQQEGLNRSFSL